MPLSCAIRDQSTGGVNVSFDLNSYLGLLWGNLLRLFCSRFPLGKNTTLLGPYVAIYMREPAGAQPQPPLASFSPTSDHVIIWHFP